MCKFSNSSVKGFSNVDVVEDANMLVGNAYDLSEGSLLKNLVDSFSEWHIQLVDFSRILSDLIYAMADDSGVADVNIVIENMLTESLYANVISDFTEYEECSDEDNIWLDFTSNLDESNFQSIFGGLIAEIRDMFIEHYKKETLRR